jgi:O-succinylbenzoic acid--CoA ligase
VGGLGILARAHLSGAKVFRQAKWRAADFVKQVSEDKITLCSLVPTQVHDLVEAGLKAPQSMRAIVVGGGALDPALYQSARLLGWPLLPSYGLTETCSQIATAGLNSLTRRDFPELKILPHAEVELREQRIFARALSICRFIARGASEGRFSLEDPLRGGWLPTEDLGEWRNRGLHILGRRDDVVKILGLLVPVNEVEHEARAHFKKLGGDLTVLAVSGGREGHFLVLVTDSASSLKEWERQFASFNAKTPGPRRLKQFCWVPEIPRGELGKVKRAALLGELRLC